MILHDKRSGMNISIASCHGSAVITLLVNPTLSHIILGT
jgi:hypothetical protein